MELLKLKQIKDKLDAEPFLLLKTLKPIGIYSSFFRKFIHISCFNNFSTGCMVPILITNLSIKMS